MNRLTMIMGGFAILLMGSCQQPSFDTIDDELSLALEIAAPNDNKSYFKLPNSNDFANIPQDPKNPLSAVKVELGRFLFHETGLATNPNDPEGYQTYSCASCHHAGAGFQAGTFQGIGDGGVGFGNGGEGRQKSDNYSTDSIDVQPIRSPTVLNSAYQKVMLWNGQFGATGLNTGTEMMWGKGTPIETNELGYEGVETQAIAGLGVHRLEIDPQFITGNAEYKQLFDASFPEIPETERYSKEMAGLAIAAYERTVLANEAPFQKYLRGDANAMTESQKKGAILFFVRARCAQCHNGPALNSESFHALGMKDLDFEGVHGVPVGTATIEGRGGFTKKHQDMYCFKVPQLYSLNDSPHYGHGASFNSIKDVIEYKNRGVKENDKVANHFLSPEFRSLNLTIEEIDQITDFVSNALDDNNLQRYQPSSIPSGLCFPNNDPVSKVDLGCQ